MFYKCDSDIFKAAMTKAINKVVPLCEKQLKKAVELNIKLDAMSNEAYGIQTVDADGLAMDVKKDIIYKCRDCGQELLIRRAKRKDGMSCSRCNGHVVHDRVIDNWNGKEYSVKSKSPLGLTPHNIWQLLRLKDIKKAMARYSEVDKEIPNEWIDEFVYLSKCVQASTLDI